MSDDRDRQLRFELMTTQIELNRKQARFENLKTMATVFGVAVAFISATAAWAALILTVAHFIK